MQATEVRTKRQQLVLDLYDSGLTTAQIGLRLGVSRQRINQILVRWRSVTLPPVCLWLPSKSTNSATMDMTYRQLT